jgi:hypothetical protein
VENKNVTSFYETKYHNKVDCECAGSVAPILGRCVGANANHSVVAEAAKELAVNQTLV